MRVPLRAHEARPDTPRRPLMIGDAHCHLADLDDADAAVAEAVAEGVSPILAVAMSPEDGERILDLRRRHPRDVRAGVGPHPSRVPEIDDDRLASEVALARERIGEADFMGEIGLDFKDARDPPQHRRQRETLERLLEIAVRAGRPVNLHTRRADGELVEIARGFTRRTGLPALMHWFTHSRRLARLCGESGIYISVGPSIEIDPRQAAVARAIVRDYLLVETDSPVAYAGRAARPARARRVALALARARGEKPGVLEAALADNLARYLRRVRPAGGGPPA